MKSRRNLRERAWVSAKLGLDPIHQSRESRTRAGIADDSFPSGVSVQLRHQPWQIFHQLPPLLRRKRTDGVFDFLKRVHGAKLPRNRQARKAAHRDSNLSGRGLAERVAVLRASHNLLEVLGLRPVLGRGFAAEEDQPGGAPVALLGQAAWHRLFGGRDDVLGQVVQLDGEPFTVIGVYVPYLQYDQATAPIPSSMAMVVRTAVEPNGILPAIRALVQETDDGLAVHDVATMTERLRDSLWLTRFIFWATTVIGCVALVLAGGGIYGMISYTAGQRTSEIGIRVALGAQRSDILRMVLRQGMKLAGMGIGLGLLVALPATQTLRSLLVGVSPADPITFVALPLLLAAVTLLACYLPARRAAKIDPMQALRS